MSVMFAEKMPLYLSDSAQYDIIFWAVSLTPETSKNAKKIRKNPEKNGCLKNTPYTHVISPNFTQKNDGTPC